jgi:outer membrane protein assembly factor BamB
MRHPFSRRAALLGAAGLLAGCETVTDLTDRVLGTSKTPLPGERRAILAATRALEADEVAAARPFSLPAPVVNTEWPFAGGPANHAPGHLALPRPLGEVWRSSIGSGTGYRQRLTAAPVAGPETVYAMDAFGWITALDAARGGRRWQTDTRPRRDRDGAMGGAIALSGDTLYAVTGLAEVMALDAATGAIKWRAPMPAPARGGIAVAGGRIMAPTVENHLVAFSTEDGSRQWVFRATPVLALIVGQPSPAVEGEVAVAGFASGEIVALRVPDGRVVWNESLGASRAAAASIADISAITALPVIDRGRVFAIGMGGAATCLDFRSGRRVWERDIGGTVTPAVAGDWLFALSRDAEMVCLSREDGRVRWITQLPRFQNEERRRNPIAWGPPLLAGGRVIVTGNHGQMLELAAASGEILSRLRLPAGATLQPAIANSSAYVLTDNGAVVCLRGVG